MVALLIGLAGCNTGGTGGAPEPMDDLDGAELNNATSAAVQDAGSYTSTTDSEFVANGSEGETRSTATSTTKVDFENERGIRTATQSISGPTLEQSSERAVYTDGDTSYRRQNSSQGVTYDTQEGEPSGFGDIRPVNVTGFNQNFTFLTDAFEFEPNGTATIDGTETRRYDSTNLTDNSAFAGSGDATVQSASSTVYLGPDNAVRQITLEYALESDGQTSETSVTLNITDLGSTTVEEPDWISEARGTETPA
jgi:hypothetical protein